MHTTENGKKISAEEAYTKANKFKAQALSLLVHYSISFDQK